ncbi:sigma-70 family RNA polymerase sigma factor [Kitasatospora sp. NBC_00240]|uniref:sigma-70 family RNA polymerase sigma factor n=1 Tax=Kitasatospora sp. NBC_00240 TaxID=2903567 RepID=UPI002252C5CF|nr:sigma-70 family RNA polymerase sigma factor [Kitasatospora sp. NBC_00240]MCX5213756.1 sigma-70 family RNA polymerase sigma factor [Kitasatospora sp. NBC_00240]
MTDVPPPGSPREDSEQHTPPVPGEGAPEDAYGVAVDATEVFVGHRELLFSIVYNMLGSVADTEDVLQEAWLAWSARAGAAGTAEAGPIEHPRAYLVRIAVNKALARQAVISRRRETYVGPWLPEPLPTTLADGPRAPEDGGEAVDRAESVSMALLVVLETLTPLERAVFVLHEVFGYAHTETAEILGRRPSAVRQLAHRAREHVQARRPRYQADPRLRQQVTERFAAAVYDGDLQALLRLLAPDVTLWADGGGKAVAAGLRPLHGRDRVARLLTTRGPDLAPRLDIRFQQVNGGPSAVLLIAGSPFAVLVLDLDPDGETVRGIYFVTNPDKLSRLDPAADQA